MNTLPASRISFLILAVFFCARAGRIAGTVRSAQTGKPVAGVVVTVEGVTSSATTDSLGSYALEDIEPGSHNLLFVHERYEPVRRNDVYVAGEGTKRVDIDLVARIYQLDKMVVKTTSFRKAPDMTASTKIMNVDEILRAPGALTDVQRAVQNLPSVSSGADNVNEVVVRGGTPGENLFVMDNIEIPNPNHFGDQGSGGGVVSLVNPLLVRKVTFNAGAPPARYGGKASSVLDVRMREGNRTIVLGGIDVGVGGAGIHAEGPMWKGSSFMLSATRSYLDFVATFDPTQAVPRFWGGQAKLTQRLPSGKLYANGVLGVNGITIGDAQEELNMDYDVIEAGGTVYAAGATWEQFVGERVSTSVTLSGVGNTFDRLTFDRAPDADTGFTNESNEQEQTGRARLSVDLDNGVRLSGGGYGRRCDFDIDIWEKPDTLRDTNGAVARDADGAPITTLSPRAQDEVAYKYGGFVSAIVPLFDRLRIIPGVRVDGFTYNHDLNVSPRLSAELSLTSALSLTGAFGFQYQDPDYATLIAAEHGEELRAKRAINGVAGVEYIIDPPGIKLMAEGFYKDYADLPVDRALMDRRRQYRFLTGRDYVSEGEGRSFGVELFAHKKLTESVFFSAAYSLSRSERRHPRIGGGEWYPADYDFGQVVTLTGGKKIEMLEVPWYKQLRRNWWFKPLTPLMPFADRIEISGRFRYRGGRPHMEHAYDSLYRRWEVLLDSPNGARYEPYHRLDIRFERRYGFGFLHMIYYFDLQNIYNRSNAWRYIYNGQKATRVRIDQLSFFPAGGVIIGF